MSNNVDTKQILSDVVVHMKYAKYIPDLQRRETFEEIGERNMNMHIKNYPQLEDEIRKVYKEYIMSDKIRMLPSMRSLQFAGKPIDVNPTRLYNCSYLHINHWKAFSEVMFLLLSGTGVGYSVQNHHVQQLPDINRPNPKRQRRFLVGDSIEGWADAVKMLMKSYFQGTSTVNFDFSDVRPKGARLVTAGGKAPGPEPLRLALEKIRAILEDKATGDQLLPIECHDILCHIADAVLAGGIRRAALISLFSADDNEMMSAKSGQWWEANPQRGRANNSVVLVRSRLKEKKFKDIIERVEASRAGEPGVFLTNDPNLGTNPCAEISLKNAQYCNLVEVDTSDLISQQDFNDRVKAAAFIATLQAGYTNFHYLRPIWQRTTERDALIGIGLTGIGSNVVSQYDETEAAKVGCDENERIAEIIGINPSSRVTTIKPSGSASSVLGTSSGIHAWYAAYYIRRIRVMKNEAIYTYLLINHPELIEDEYFSPHDTAVISIPIKAPENSLYRTETAIDTLNRVKRYYKNWIKPGHRKGSNTNNISVTVNVKDDEWNGVADWMWTNRDNYTAISLLPYDNGTYVQAPFEEITEDKYNELAAKSHEIDLTQVVELEDNTNVQQEAACFGANCSVE